MTDLVHLGRLSRNNRTPAVIIKDPRDPRGIRFIALTPDEARQTAGELINMAESIDGTRG